MTTSQYPAFFKKCLRSNDDALKQYVRSDTTIASGFATNEPHGFYDRLWDFIEREDIHDLRIRQALFMAPHRLCLGDALQSRGMFADLAETEISKEKFLGLPIQQTVSILSNVARAANGITRKVEGLKRLTDHYRRLQERRITFASPFIGQATNIVIPSNAMTRLMCPEFVGRNTTRMGVTDMQSIHFPDAIDAMAYDPDGRPLIDTFVAITTPPNADGYMSHGPANAANGEAVARIAERTNVNLLLYINGRYPFTRGYTAPGTDNTIHVNDLAKLAEAGRLIVVEDDGKIPALPADSFANPSPDELKIAENAVNHIELNKHFTYGRAIQVGIGGTGVLVIRALKDSSWHGRSYTEMLEPFTLDLFDSGKIKGSHFIETDGRRTQLDGKLVCTFTIAEENSGFYERIDNNPAVVLAPASRVVIPAGFVGGLGVNNCLAVDFHGHVNSGGRFTNHHSGVGGGAVIHRGLLDGGVAYLCLKSTYRTQDGKLRSSITPFMERGTPISHIGPDLMGGRNGARAFLVTEHGIAQVSGRTQSEFIRALISIAAPEFRDWLAREAFEQFRVRV